MTADQLPVSRSALIKEIKDSPLRINLMELGFLPGKTIKLQHVAPSNGPMAFCLDDTMLALRKSEAALLDVQLL
ncbi:FeoA family protein [Algoriphagus sp. CAU 1675]|uniref:FeoA family protein n=1 Tax=Algoriphagus sp. CAU 1675 TaxID=3032597 RepID=UPI0023DBBC12|nr:FeoA family protein [Algoriphagus sp. CAU 1675]MDF2158223.1 FeoA family protein [Algoriphagus sp. CAU 1675]